jgi:uncharacterized protein YkwD
MDAGDTQKRSRISTFLIVLLISLIIFLYGAIFFFYTSEKNQTVKNDSNNYEKLLPDNNFSLNNTNTNKTQSQNISKNQTINKSQENPTPKEKTCLENRGKICGSEEKCSVSLVSASNTNRCCLGTCLKLEQTCLEKEGTICKSTELCDAPLNSASDTNLCCLGTCIVKEQPKPQPSNNSQKPSEIELGIHNLVNEERTNEGLSTLSFDNGLAEVARKHSQDMIDRQFFDHINPDGFSPFDRMKQAGISFSTAGENIELVYQDYGCGDGSSSAIAQCLFDGWMNSPGHRENMMDRYYHKEGLGVVIDSNGAVYATELFSD